MRTDPPSHREVLVDTVTPAAHHVPPPELQQSVPDARLTRATRSTDMCVIDIPEHLVTPPASTPGPSGAGLPVTRQERRPLPSRREVVAQATRQVVRQIVDTATHAAHHVHLPEVTQAVADASITRAIGATAMSVVQTPARLVAQAASTLRQSGTSWLNQSRVSSLPLQLALDSDLSQVDPQEHAHPSRLSNQPLQLALEADLSQADPQEHAHREAVWYGQHAATVLDSVLPAVHAMLKIGGAGTSMAFGLGRNSGMAAGDALGRLERGAEQAWGLVAGPELPATALSSGTALKLGAAGLQQWLLGAATGAVGNMAGQYLAAPLVNLIPRQHQKIDDRAVLPQGTQMLMNILQPGAGDALRAQVQQAQDEIANIDSDSNKRLGEAAFGAVFAARFAAMATPLGAAGQVLAGLVMSAGAGMGIGAVMATRQATAMVEIPDLDALCVAVETFKAALDDGEATLAAVKKNAVPLFYARHSPTAPAEHTQPADIETGDHVATADAQQRGRLAAMASRSLDAVKWVTQPLAVGVHTLAGSLSASPLLEPTLPGMDEGLTARRVVGTFSNVAASGFNRGMKMAGATAMTSLLSTVGAILATGTDGAAQRVALTVLNSVGIQLAIVPWFNALAVGIPKFDAAILAHRQQVVNGLADT